MHKTSTIRPRSPADSPIARRFFLGRIARFGGVGVAAGMTLRRAIATAGESVFEEESAKKAPADHTTTKSGGGRGTTEHVRDEIQEYRDDETGARVRRLTADGSDNVHLYFTSESFLADDRGTCSRTRTTRSWWATADTWVPTTAKAATTCR